MSLSGLRKVMGLAVGFVLLAGVAPLFAQTGGITGICKGQKGEPLVDHKILIERQQVRGNYPTKTNKKGEYIYIGLPIGDYKVTLKDPNGRDLFFQGTHVGIGDPTELNFDLAKETARAQEEQKKELESNPELRRQREELDKDLKQNAGLREYFDQGVALMDEKKYAEAAQMFEQALPLAKGKDVPTVQARVADAYGKAAKAETSPEGRTKAREKAVEYFQKAIESNPADAGWHDGLGNVYAEMRKVAEAAAEFKKAAELNPTQASRYYFNYGVVMYNTGNMDEAAGAFKKATEIDANYADAFYWQGLALMGKASMTADGKVTAPPGTVENLETYLKLEPNGKNAESARAMLQTVQGQIQTEYKAVKKKKG